MPRKKHAVNVGYPDANGLSPSKQIKVQTRGPADKSGVKPGRKKLYVSNAESNVDGHGDGSLDVKQENEGDGSLLSKEAAATPLPRYNLRGRNRLENASKAELTIEKSKDTLRNIKTVSVEDGVVSRSKKHPLMTISRCGKAGANTKKSEATSDSVTVKQSGSADATLHAKKNSCTDGSDGDHRDVKKDAAVKESCDPVVRKVALKSGDTPVDSECPLIGRARVFTESGVVLDCMLNQTDVGANNNKYYIIQLLEEIGAAQYHVWQRWGRVGYKGQSNLASFGNGFDSAMQIFAKKFHDKTKNIWLDKDAFMKFPGKYDLVQLDYSAKEDEQSDCEHMSDNKNNNSVSRSGLPPAVQDLISLIFDVKSMEEAVLEMKYDAKKAPLGKLTKDQIKAGYLALKAIETLIQRTDFGPKLSDACSLFYTRIPHCFGMKVPPMICSLQDVKEKMQLLETLGDIEYAMRILRASNHDAVNVLDHHYESLSCHVHPVDKSTDSYQLVESYLMSTHADTHNQYRLQLLDLFELDKSSERVSYRDVGNRMLLWHGSRITNWAGILGQGLRIAPPEAPVSGYMFGKGVYFADMSSKSANYCCTSRKKNVGLLLLCDVSLGVMNERLDADFNAHKLPHGKHSVKGCGSMAPDLSTYRNMCDGCVVPTGKGTRTKVVNPKGCMLNYNEYIVYDTKQIRMKYLLKVKFNYY